VTLPSGTVQGDAHRFPLRVYYEDTDAAGIVYYANYLKFAERARTEMLRLLGFEHAELRRSTGGTFAVRHCSADYLAPAHLDDELVVSSRLLALGAASLELDQRIQRGERELVRLTVRLAYLRSDLRPTRLPAEMRTALAQLSRPTRGGH
jgi:acyl-CoA thioester hydrolase